jgi:hypothetical protein
MGRHCDCTRGQDLREAISRIRTSAPWTGTAVCAPSLFALRVAVVVVHFGMMHTVACALAEWSLSHAHVSNGNRMLRLVLQVPVAATLYMRSLSLLAEESIQDEGTGAGAARRRPRLTTHAAPEQANHMHHAAPAQSNRMHHVAERLAVQQVARRVEVSHSMALRSTADVAAPGVAKQERERSRRRVAVTHVGKHAAAASESTAPRGPAL